MSPVEYSHTIHQPRPVVYRWFNAPGAHQRLTPPGTATILDGNDGESAVGDTLTLQPGHPLLSAIPGFNAITGTVSAHVDSLRDGELIAVTFTHGRKTWTQETNFRDAPGGTIVTQRFLGLPKAAQQTALAQMKFLAKQADADLTLIRRLDAAPATIVVAGASGLVGTQLTALLRQAGHTVRRLVRREATAPDEIQWNPDDGLLPSTALDGADAVVNLAGRTIGGRFTDTNKRKIMESRANSTRTLARAIADHPVTLVQASAVGIYGARRPGETLTECSARGQGFLADVVATWEKEAQPAIDAGARTVFLRTGVAQSYAGGALQPQVALFLLGAGGRIAAKDHHMPWVGIDDLVRAYVHALFTPELQGPVNVVGPETVTNAEFASTLGRVLSRPSLLPTPAFGPSLILGREGYDQLINTDQLVSANKLTASGFHFAQPTVEEALRHTLLR